MHRYQQQITR